MSPATAGDEHEHREAELEQILLHCAEHGDLDLARELLVEIERVNVDCTDEKGRTPLMCAAGWGHVQVVRLLLENGANVEVTADLGWTALSSAVYWGRVATAQILLEHGANVETHCWSSTALANAIAQSDDVMVTLLLRHGANTEKTLANGKNCNALFFACEKNNVEIVRLLLDHKVGVDVNAISPRDSNVPAMTPLCEACKNGNLEMAQLLIQHGARVIYNNGALPDVPCPLVHAVKNKAVELVQLLLDHSCFSEPANENARFPEGNNSHPLSQPLETAIQRNRLQAAQLLVNHGAHVNDRPFLWQCAGPDHNKRLEAARLLLRAGANVNLVDGESGETPLRAAAKNGNVKLVKEFLKVRANLRIRDNNGETPLSVAYRQGHKDIVYLLLRTSPHVWSKLEEVW